MHPGYPSDPSVFPTLLLVILTNVWRSLARKELALAPTQALTHSLSGTKTRITDSIKTTLRGYFTKKIVKCSRFQEKVRDIEVRDIEVRDIEVRDIEVRDIEVRDIEEVETDQAIEEPTEIMHINHDVAKTARGGRVRSTTPAEDRYIVLSAKRNRRTTAQQVANQFLAASGKQISRKTVARRLRGGGLYARRPVVCVPLTRQHRTARLQWCREHHNWTEQDWACVLFSDESRFSLSSDCRRQLIWRESGTAYRPENIQEKDRYPTCSIMVGAGIMINGRTRLHVVVNGTMTGQRYIDEVLLPHVRLFRGAVGDKFVFMDDNATCHRTLAVQDCLDSEGIQRLVYGQRVLQI
ncbi:transposable element Tc3 transposase-like Protein [Trichonephila clavipes]|nr:transposable element Tc3 transposase-like Protein [Trichonephila clavipes]